LFASKQFDSFSHGLLLVQSSRIMNRIFAPVVRHATVEDAALLAELAARTFAETFAADNSAEDMAAYLASSFGRAQQAAELADPQCVVLIAEIDGVAAGYAKLHAGPPPQSVTDQKSVELVRLYVSREWLGRGVGAALMRVCISEAMEQDYRTIWLGVWEHNSRARDFYQKWNFREVGEHIFQLGDDSQRDIVMERSISENRNLIGGPSVDRLP
jgi:diamine N-acetyltransferase